jgi:hypothetical protein
MYTKPSQSTLERRSRRSPESHIALSFQLEHTREHGNLEAVVLTDRSGLAVAHAGDSSLCEELAAIAPVYSLSVMPMRLPPQFGGGEVAVRRLSLHGQDLYLACVGGGVARDALLASSVSGVQRILASN